MASSEEDFSGIDSANESEAEPESWEDKLQDWLDDNSSESGRFSLWQRKLP